MVDGSAEPGHVGATVIAGHVDSRSGPGVFYRLEELTAGDEITVVGADGTEVTYAVDRIEQFPKDEFPTRDIYGPTPEPTPAARDLRRPVRLVLGPLRL